MTQSDSPNPYQSPREEAGKSPAAEPPLSKRDFAQLYWSPVLATGAMLVFYTPWIVYEWIGPGGAPILRPLFGLAVMAMLALMVTWLVAPCQFIIAITYFFLGKRKWKHHLLAAVWAAAWMLLWAYLADMGYFLTV